MLEVKNLCKTFGSKGNLSKAVDNASFKIEKGEIAVLAGPSGSGKTTLLNLIGGLDTPSEGTIIIDGKNMTDLPQKKVTEFRKNNIGFVFQNYNLIKSLNVYQNVCFPFKLNHSFDAEAEKKVEDILKKVGLWEKRKNLPHQLSGGQQQRVAIARAVVSSPALILADEPTANLDTENAIMVIELFKKLNNDEGITIVISSHDQRVIDMVDVRVRLVDGKVQEVIRK